MATPEGEIVNAICDYLALKQVFFWRQNTAPTVYRGTNGMQFRKMPKYARKGVPDIIAIKTGTFYGIEVKTAVGRLSPEQVDFGRECVRNGGEYIVARSIEDVQGAGL